MAAPEIVDLASLERAILTAHQCFKEARPWWRGHGKTCWQLRPRIFRPDAGTSGSKHYREREFLAHFRDRAMVRHGNVPLPNDHIGWMFLAQHYGLPTRLLDWSASPLIGLYFAVYDERYDSEPGHLYALSPGRLNVATAGQQTERFSTSEPLVQQYALDAIGNTEKVYADKLPIAITICTREIDVRMLVQQSVFTLHADETQLLEIHCSKAHTISFTIPASAKQAVRHRLAWLGLRPSNVFPDLEHLAAELGKAEFLNSLV